MNIYERQKDLSLKKINSLLVVGCGGIGSWAALAFALYGVEKVFLVDPDIVEYSNLNRTPYRLRDVGRPKVVALTELILERRLCTVVPLQDRVEDVVTLIPEVDVVLDCRDTVRNKSMLQRKGVVYLKLGYDGFSYTIDTLRSEDLVFGEESTTYTVVPSFVGTPMYVVSTVVCTLAQTFPELGEKIVTKEVPNDAQ